LFFVFLIMVLALVACTEKEETPAEPTAVPEAAVPTEAPAEPVEVPTQAPAEAHAAPAESTEAPAQLAEAAAEPVEAPAEPRLGILRFRDSDSTRAGSYQLLLEGVSVAPAGSHYELWLVDGSFNTLNLGEFVANSDVNFSGSTDQNLLGSHNAAFVSIEADGVADGEIGPVVFNGVVPAGSLLHVRHIVTAFPANPDGKAFLIGAEEQLLQAIEHAGFLLDELAKDNIREVQRHAEHVVNILDGESGASFGDLDGDTIAQNPGDGFGVRAYFDGAKEHAQLAVDAEDATAEVELHAGHVLISSDNALARLDGAIGEALRIIASDSATEAQPAADELARLLDAAFNGQDANGDGAIAPIEDEGGFLTAYEHALNMGSFEFFAADGVAVAAPSEAAAAPVAEPVEAPAEPTEALTAEPTEALTAEPVEAPAPVTIDMANFAFQPGDITVPVGTAVTWVNKDNGPRHSATAADGSFDTGLLDGGQETTIVFDTPGTYVYYCTLHGSPDGSGMAATITVTQ
jgi:plastocyanin